MKNFFSNIIKEVKDLQVLEKPEQDKEKLISENLKESEIRYRRLFESAKDGILILDFETGHIIDANPFIINIIDYPLNEIIGKKLWEIGLFSNKEESEKAFIELQKKGYIRYEDMPIQRRNGKTTEVEFISNVYLTNDAKVIQCNIRDITERKQLESELIESEQKLRNQNSDYLNLNKEYSSLNKELTESINRIQNINNELTTAKLKAEESDTLKSAFLANMSHEIRTPMNAIIGFSEFLTEPGLSKEKTEDYVQIINVSCQQLLTVIGDIIDISKIEAGQITMISEVVDINHLINELYITYKKTVGLKKVSINYSCEFPNDQILIRTDGNRIKQIFCNLLNNAIKFTVEGEIEFGYKIRENFIVFYVKDTGIGIAPENQDLIFQRFRQIETSRVRKYGGNGLGLSISRALVDKLGGTISVVSNFGEGSSFTFSIPYVKETEKNNNPAISTEPGQLNNWDGKTILIVEDEINNHSYIEALLSASKVRLLHAWDGREAVEQVEKNSDISLVLMDIKMPFMDGYEATQIIKLIRPKLPVIAQTAYATSHDRELALESGFDDYITKPIDKGLLMKAINTYLS